MSLSKELIGKKARLLAASLPGKSKGFAWLAGFQPRPFLKISAARPVNAVYITTKAVVLSSQPQGEYDYLIRVLSEAYGLMTLKMRGVRRPTSRLKIFKEPGVFADLHVWMNPRQTGMARLLTGQVFEDFSQIRHDIARWLAVSQILNFTELFLTPFDPKAQEKLLVVLETLSRLADALPSQTEALVLAAKLKTLDLSGWKFSATQIASLLDANIKEICVMLESGFFPDALSQGNAFKTIHRAVDLHTTHLLERRVTYARLS